MSLCSTVNEIDEKEAGEIIFSAVNQVNRGKSVLLKQSSQVKIDIAKLNKRAGVDAVKCSDFVTARTHFDAAMSLLPRGHWESDYELSLNTASLLAEAAHSSGDSDKAFAVVETILSEAHCFSDKLGAYHLLVRLLFYRSRNEDAYMTGCQVLSELGESIPDIVGPDEVKETIRDTAKLLVNTSEETLLKMDECMDSNDHCILKFYYEMAVVSFFYRMGLVPYFSCRMAQYTLKKGRICTYSLQGKLAIF